MKTKLNCILLVDDDEATNFLNRKNIIKLGITEHIQAVLNGKEALDFLTTPGNYGGKTASFPKPQLIILDVNMPVMNGWEFLDEYEKLGDEKKGEIIIVMISTSFNSNDEQLAKSFSSVSGYNRKPLSREEITDLIQTYFPDQV